MITLENTTPDLLAAKTPELDYSLLKSMEFGGGFEQALVTAIYRADDLNLKRLAMAFPCIVKAKQGERSEA